MKTMKILAALALSVTLSNAANAATCQTAVTDPMWESCIGLFEGNIQQNGFNFGDYTDAEDNLGGYSFDYDDWSYVGGETTYSGGDIALTGDYDMFAVLLKAGSSWGAYLYTSTSTLQSWWDGFITVERTAVNSLSNYSVYGRVSEVPLPAAGWLLIAGLGGMAALGRRRKSA